MNVCWGPARVGGGPPQSSSVPVGVGFGFLRDGEIVRVIRLDVVGDAVAVVVLDPRRFVAVVSVGGGVVARWPDLATEVVLSGRGVTGVPVPVAVAGGSAGADSVGAVVGLPVGAVGAESSAGHWEAAAGVPGGLGCTTRERATAAAPPASQLAAIAGRGVVRDSRAAARPAAAEVVRSTAAASRVKPRKSTTAAVTTAQSAHAPSATGTDRPELVISQAR